MLAKITLPQLSLLSINPNSFNLQTRFRMLFTAIILSLNLFCALHINDEIKTPFTLFSLHYRPIFTMHFAISFSVSCFLPISLQPICSIKTSGVSSFKIGFTYVSICSRVAPINVLNRVTAFIQF